MVREVREHQTMTGDGPYVSCKKIAQKYGLEEGTVYQWLKRIDTDAGVETAARGLEKLQALVGAGVYLGKADVHGRFYFSSEVKRAVVALFNQQFRSAPEPNGAKTGIIRKICQEYNLPTATVYNWTLVLSPRNET